MHEGYIKFNCTWQKAPAPDQKMIDTLNRWRSELYRMHLIGCSSSGIGFGNISIRTEGKQFLISGSATGSIAELTSQHYTYVISYDIDRNNLLCQGPIQASSESLTHAAVYETVPHINSVIHIHSRSLWEKKLATFPSTAPHAEYGTVAMAHEVMRLCGIPDTIRRKIIIMAGHEEGIISFGSSLEEAGMAILDLIKIQ
ncbi:MAG: class II aldolase/adducin family protein [Chitinivibrionales bacterium]|nr:class II aldolase/adducin family protein [Chitinivibrionales bacterium]